MYGAVERSKTRLCEEDESIEKEALSKVRKDLAAICLIGIAFVLILAAVLTARRF